MGDMEHDGGHVVVLLTPFGERIHGGEDHVQDFNRRPLAMPLAKSKYPCHSELLILDAEGIPYSIGEKEHGIPRAEL